jgi:hypothetical protein
MTMVSQVKMVLGITLLLLVLPGTVYLLLAGHVPRWFAVLQVMVAGGFLAGGITVLVVKAVIADRREEEP